jgi:sortase A
MSTIKPFLKIAATAVAILGLLIITYASIKYTTFSFEHENTHDITLNEPESTNNKSQNKHQSIPEPIVDNNEGYKDTSFILLYPKRPEKGEKIGQIKIPNINVSLPIIHGTDDEQLEKGVGHYPGSVLPGEPDHSILSGHRDTVLSELKDIDLKDTIIISTSAGTFTYEVINKYIVDADDTTVIKPTSEATLSLTTCYPFSYIGNAPQRFIVHSKLIDHDLKKTFN